MSSRVFQARQAGLKLEVFSLKWLVPFTFEHSLMEENNSSETVLDGVYLWSQEGYSGGQGRRMNETCLAYRVSLGACLANLVRPWLKK